MTWPRPLSAAAEARDDYERLEEALRRSEAALSRVSAELAALTEASQALSRLADPAELLEQIYRALGAVVDNRNLYIALVDEPRRRLTFPIYTIDGERQAPAARPFANGLTEHIIRTRRPLWIPRDVSRTLNELGITPIGREARSYLGVPIIAGERIIGVIGVQDYEREDVYVEAHRDLLTTFAAQAAVALENARLFAQATSRFKHIQALREIDAAITGTTDARVAMGILLEKVTTSLGVDAADLLTFNPASQTLEFLVGRGFRSSALRHTRLRIGQGYAGRAVLERAIIRIGDLRESPGELVRAQELVYEDFVAYHAVPLIVKGQVNGVLEIFHRDVLHPDEDWMDFLATVAGQAAVALESAMLFERLQRANADLSLAYDTTLEGWVRALDLRDKETEGHTRRVTELTLRLARAMGVAPEQLVHIRRGALLHDIGKMGIPDRILLKPGPLSEEEAAILRRHAEYARDLLAPIAYLRPALAIPSCHHEHWDGSGYPQGLRGEEIPLEARIFAVVDAWDNLTSGRPHRPAMTPEQARGHIRALAGKQFDPAVVAAFLSLPEIIAVA